jgi:hypothetical protein
MFPRKFPPIAVNFDNWRVRRFSPPKVNAAKGNLEAWSRVWSGTFVHGGRCSRVIRASRLVLGYVMNSPVIITVEQSRAKMSVVRSGWDAGSNDSRTSQSPGWRHPDWQHPDWRHAVCVATALISDKWVLPETACNAAITGMAEELAPLLCAYGL